MIAGYFVRINDLTLRGEETRRAQIAREMLWTGDWVVPRQQGEPFLSRPPLQNWLIAAGLWLTHEVSPFVIRLPSVLSVLGTVVLLYGYTRCFLSPLGSLAAGTIFASMGQVLELGRLAETEALFTLLVTGSLLLWHCCQERQTLRWLAWPIGYTLAALATLTKGPQAPTYFVLVTWGWLLWRRGAGWLFHRSHLIGLGLFLAILTAWHVPLYQELDWPGVRAVWTGDAAMRFVDTRWTTLLLHFAKFPLATFACTLPGSVLLAILLSRGLRLSLDEDVRRRLGFLVFSVIITYPTCWLTPGAQGRYFMPLYPCIAAIAGIAVHGLFGSGIPWLSQLWRWLIAFGALVMLLSAAGALASGFGAFSDLLFFEGRVERAVFAGGSLLAAAILALALRRPSPAMWSAALLSIAGFCALVYNGPFVNRLRSTSVDIAGAVADLRQRLPEEHRLVSFGAVHHAFAFHYASPIEMRPFPASVEELDEGRYFCFNRYFRPEEKLPFEWEQVAVVSCSRSRRTADYDVVVVGRAIRRRPR